MGAADEKDLFMPTTGPIDYGTNTELFQEVRRFVEAHFDYPDEKAYDVITSWILATYRLAEWDAMPFLFFLGAEGSGKTRALEVIQYLAKRAFLVANISSAATFRMDEDFHPTYCLDESEYLAQEEKVEIIGLVNTRYRKTGKVIRVGHDEEGDPNLETFSVYGFTALAGTKPMIQTLESRCIVFHMTPSLRKVRMFMAVGAALTLRNKLLKYAEDNVSEPPVGVTSESLDVSSEEESLVSLCLGDSVIGRDAEIFYPLLECAPDNGPRALVSEFAKEYIDTKKRNRSFKGDALIYGALVKAHSITQKRVVFLHEIKNVLDDWLPEKESFKQQTIGHILREIGFEPKRSTGGKAAVDWNQNVIDRLAPRYNYDDSLSSLGSLETNSDPQNTGLTRLTTTTLKEVDTMRFGE